MNVLFEKNRNLKDDSIYAATRKSMVSGLKIVNFHLYVKFHKTVYFTKLICIFHVNL